MTQETELSLREQILAANTPEEISDLLGRGHSPLYRFATSATRGRWRSAARKRNKELKGAK